MRHLPSQEKSLKRTPTVKEDKSGDNIYDKDGQYVTGAKESKLQVHAVDNSEPSLWQREWEQTKAEIGVDNLKGWNPLDTNWRYEVESVARVARDAANDTQENERRIAGSHYTYRRVYDNIANWAHKFEIVTDLITQVNPGYATLPWALIRFAITTAVGETKTYHLMLEGTELVSQLVTQYPVIEQTYARVDSDLASALRKTLFSLYVGILRFQIRAIKYFDPDRKFLR
ncbi:hypothetical protein N7G274_008013 [Stereocaulon virgatum]|uniref:DUF7708 domain-containing protein n=1 Tax=Stereocaulon virgatum TaxID=373712 RepID=A0ABR4A2R0_9LECA